MNLVETVLGIILFVVFWAFQAGYAAPLGGSAWFAGAIIFTVLLWLVAKSFKRKPPAGVMELWMFATAFLIVSTFVISYLGPSLGAVAPSGDVTPLILSFWLVVYGAAMFATGHKTSEGITLTIAVIWLFSALHFVTAVGTGPNSYLHFGLVTGLPFILEGLIRKK